MAEEIVIHSDDEGAPSPEESSAHDAAVAEGASAVHEQNADEAANEAKAAAEVGLATAQATIEAAQVAEESADRAEAAAEQSTITLEMMHETLLAQGTAIAALTSELKASRESEPVEEAPEEPEHDEAPGKEHWYLRKVGRNREG